jgi:hypothetical protein
MRSRTWRTRLVIGAAAMSHAVLSLDAAADTAIISSARDATLIESATGALANGSGPVIFVGRTSQQSASRRRALVAFDVAAALPGGSIVTGVALEAELSLSHPDPVDIGVYRVAVAWSEGPSASSGGSGDASLASDVTWVHTRYDTDRWAQPGGDFAAQPSATAEVGDVGIYRIESNAALVADVQAWLDAPASNHGWILIGGEEAGSTAKRFYSREAGREGEGPRLVIEYVPPCEAGDLSASARGVCRAYCEALDCDGIEPRGDDGACEKLAVRFAATSGDAVLPCERPAGPECPCFTTEDVTALVRALQDPSVYTDLDCTDSTPAKPLTAVTAVRIDGADCSAESADCSALSVTFTEDNACQLNPPLPTAPVSVGGISEIEREACRGAILAGALAAGIACE